MYHTDIYAELKKLNRLTHIYGLASLEDCRAIGLFYNILDKHHLKPEIYPIYTQSDTENT
jgi:hypothetical protein